MTRSTARREKPERNCNRTAYADVLSCDREEQALNARDDQSFTEYVTGHGAGLLRIAYLLTGNRDTAQELVQSVLARALLRWGRITQFENIDAYLRRALINERTSQWRRFGRREAPVATPPHAGIHDEITQSDERQALLGVLRQLPRKQRAALVLRFFEDLPDDEIAAILDCSTSTVRTHVARGLATLRTTLDITAGDPAQDHALNGGHQ
ncbi:MAG: SigE family RNA polymerase sigma factor [Actinomycetota bacterium]